MDYMTALDLHEGMLAGREPPATLDGLEEQ
jgi:hypothetical protein